MKNHIYNYLGLLTVTSTVAVAGAAPAQAIVFDDFSEPTGPPQPVQEVEDNVADGNEDTDTATFTNSGVGVDLDREIAVNLTADNSNVSTDLLVSRVDSSSIGIESTDLDNDAEGESFIRYTPTTASSFDLSNAPALQIVVEDTDQPGVNLSSSIGTVGNPTTSLGSKTLGEINNPKTFSFNLSGVSNTDETDFVQFKFDSAGVAGADVEATQVNAVPYEMETGFGLAAVAALFGYRKFRKSRAKRQNNAVAE